MHVITFYSFKGGVGRTMALVNVAADLARSGRRVLMVDFDLEAPGLSEYGFLKPLERTPGVVEFVSDYIKSGTSPNVNRYVYLSKKYAETEDRLWVMPAGCQQTPGYQRLFASINWQELYEQNDGFLLMEDLRSQWEEACKFDYVFIDSRTGYTDIAGICTRQLPDTVCLFFAPNRQNLAGLRRITSDIKAQSSSSPRLRNPQLRFIASNVPNLDDDEHLLEKALGEFSEQLEYSRPTAVIQHYSSFALLDEVVFTLEHPKSQLAKQYSELAYELTKNNLRDKIAALEFLRAYVREALGATVDISVEELDEKLRAIEGYFSDDKEVLYWLSRVRRALGSLDEASVLLDAAMQKGLDTPRAFLDRASLKFALGTEESIWEDLRQVLWSDVSANVIELLTAIRLAFRIGRTNTSDFEDAKALKALSNEDFTYLAYKLENSKPGIALMLKLALEALEARQLSTGQSNRLLGYVGNAYIAFGELDRAVQAFLRTTTADLTNIPLDQAFNLGVAKYWKRDEDAKLYLNRALEMYPEEAEAESDLNLLQCLAFLQWVLQGSEIAKGTIFRAKKLLETKPLASFSCWRYLQVPPAQFKQDLDEMQRLFDGDAVLPVFLRAPLSVKPEPSKFQ